MTVLLATAVFEYNAICVTVTFTPNTNTLVNCTNTNSPHNRQATAITAIHAL